MSHPVDFLIAGLGNPGSKYSHTRHNAGYLVIEEIAKRHGICRNADRFLSKVGYGNIEGKSVALLTPCSYMNLSGRSVRMAARSLLSHYSLGTSDEANEKDEASKNILIIHDDMNIPLGTLRLRTKGSSGGHKGLQSVLEALETKSVPRLRVGIGRPPVGVDPKDFVLTEFEFDELARLQEAVNRAADGVEMILEDGFEAAMTFINSKDLENMGFTGIDH
jgi:PTH1 family peptidyl-tRNA hydrolase